MIQLDTEFIPPAEFHAPPKRTNGEEQPPRSRGGFPVEYYTKDVMENVPYNITENFLQHYIFENPDPIVQLESRKGLTIYDDMDLDPIIGACWELVENAIIGMDWEIEAASEDAIDEQKKLFIEDAILNINGNLWKGNAHFGGYTALFVTILDSMKMGYSIGQAIWNLSEAVIVEVKHEIPQAFYFYDNETEDAPYNYQWTGTDMYYRDALNAPLQKAPPYKFMHFIYRGKYGNPYGRSIYRRAYWPFLFGFIEGIRSWSHFIERYGDPWLIGLIDESLWNDENYVTRFHTVLNNLQRAYTATLPRTKDGHETVKLLESNRQSSSNVFSEYTDKMDRLKAIGIIGSPLLVMESEFGTRAQSQVQNEAVFQNLLRGWADWFMSQMQVPIQWMCDLKYGRPPETAPANSYPKLKLQYDPPANLSSDIEIDAVLSSIVDLPTSWFYSHYGRPAPKKGEDIARSVSKSGINVPGTTLINATEQKELKRLYDLLRKRIMKEIGEMK
jgi:hypothetical protein